MFKVKAQSLIDSWEHPFECETELEANEWVAKQQAKKKHWGRFRGAGEFSKSELDREGYDESLVVSSRTDEEYGTEYITLLTDYSYEIIDLSLTHEYQLEQCYKARKEAYGQLDSQLDEMYHDFNAWKARIEQIKIDNPKPIKE